MISSIVTPGGPAPGIRVIDKMKEFFNKYNRPSPPSLDYLRPTEKPVPNTPSYTFDYENPIPITLQPIPRPEGEFVIAGGRGNYKVINKLTGEEMGITYRGANDYRLNNRTLVSNTEGRIIAQCDNQNAYLKKDLITIQPAPAPTPGVTEETEEEKSFIEKYGIYLLIAIVIVVLLVIFKK